MMNETQMQEALQSIREQLTGNLLEDELLIQKKAAEYDKQGETEIQNRLLDMALHLMPKDKLDFLKETVYIGERPMSAVYRQAAALMQKQEFSAALALTQQLYDKIVQHFGETPERRFFSFRNLLESNLYYHLYNPSKRLEKTPFDFPLFLTAHAYCLLELRRPDEAVPVLETAIRFNPLNPDPRFELAEVYKFTHRDAELLRTIRETLPVCAMPYALSRCYANLGFYCTNIKDYESAVCFYFESLLYMKHPMIRAELAHLSQLMQKEIKPPTRQDVLAAFEKHDVMNGANPELLTIARALADQALEKREWEPASFYLRVLKDLTGNEQAAAQYAQCQEELKKAKSAE